MRELAVAIQNENDGVSIEDTIKSIKSVGYKNVFVQWYNEEWDCGQEVQIQMCKDMEFNILFAHLGYQNMGRWC